MGGTLKPPGPSKMAMQDYLCPNEISVDEAKFIFHVRTRMLDVKTNYSERYTDSLCPICKNEEDTQKHLLECSKLDTDGDIVTKLPEYDHLFSEKLDDKVKIAKIIKQRYEKRTAIIKDNSS